MVRKIFELYREGYGYSYIAEYLNQKGYPSPSSRQGLVNAAAAWNAVAVQRILSNRVYIGDTVQGVSEKVSFKSKKTRRLPSDKWVITVQTHEPIIAREEFEEVQKIRAGKGTRSEPYKGHLHMFKGVLFCGGCGSTLFARMRKGRPMAYICGNYSKGGKNACESHHSNEKELNNILLDQLQQMLKNKQIRQEVIRILEQEAREEEPFEAELEKLQQQLAVKRKQQDTLYMDRLEGKISEDLFNRMNTVLEQKILGLKREIETLEVKEKSKREYDSIIDEMLADLLNNGLQYELVKLLVEKITIYCEKDSIDGLIGIRHGKNTKIETNGVVCIDFNFEKPTINI